MDDRDWSGPLGHSNWHSRLRPQPRSGWKLALGILTVIGILASVAHELFAVGFEPFGVASVARPLHALLGLAALLWVLFGFRLGLVALVLWIVLAIPILGFDPSGEWVKPYFSLHLSKSQMHWSLVNGEKVLTAYRIVGVNFAPLLAALWFGILARKGVFPVVRRRELDAWN